MRVEKILFITLSNIGDVILTFPSLDTLREYFPKSRITCVTSPRAKELFEGNPFIYQVIVFHKQSSLKEKIDLFNQLKKEKFDLIVDLRNSFYGMFLPARYKNPFFLKIPGRITHMKDRHLYKIQKLIESTNAPQSNGQQETSIFTGPQDEMYIKLCLKKGGVTKRDKLVIVAMGAKSHIKRWSKDKFAELIFSMISEFGVKIVLVGDGDDRLIAESIMEDSPEGVVDLTAKTNLTQLAYLLKNAHLVITNDSATMHLVSYLNLPVVAIFGPTDEAKYGPWSDYSLVAKKDIFCRPCEKAQCQFNNLQCTDFIKIEDVLNFAQSVLSGKEKFEPLSLIPILPRKNVFKRILVARTDRIGDVLLSTPVLKNLRLSYPHAYIAMMTSPYAKDVVEGNPYIDEVIIFDKDFRHKGWVNSMRFARDLAKKKFDLALILHPTKRVHLITFFARIKRRIGWDRKFGWLLTDRLTHTKQLGEKHELEYNLDFLRYLDIEPKSKKVFMPIKDGSEEWVDQLFKENNIGGNGLVLAIHPGASCPSKIWPNERFAEVADRLTEKYPFKVIILAGPQDVKAANEVARRIEKAPINLAGMTSLSQMASLLKRSSLFISNDSGPVHIASAVGTPVISIFGRGQKGLSPLRWGPVGEFDRILHKDVGCVECLAHNCHKEYACLKAISVDDVVKLADEMLRG